MSNQPLDHALRPSPEFARAQARRRAHPPYASTEAQYRQARLRGARSNARKQRSLVACIS